MVKIYTGNDLCQDHSVTLKIFRISRISPRICGKIQNYNLLNVNLGPIWGNSSCRKQSHAI